MNNLPNDPHMLVSVVNTKLRDNYDSLDALCEDMGVNQEQLVLKLLGADYSYDARVNQFK
jgi:hypothetical protein